VPRYFFDTANGSRFHDTDGVEMADRREARIYAVRFAGECIADDPELLETVTDFRVEVRDSDGLMLFTVTTFVTESPAARR